MKLQPIGGVLARPAIRVLVVTDRCGDFERLVAVLAGSRWEACCARSVAEATDLLRKEGAAGVILCERRLPDGTWRDVLNAAGHQSDSPRVIVMSRTADDELWNDVLAGGGYDVVPIPFDSREIFRVVTLAWNHWAAHRRPSHGVRQAAKVA
ncbi:MAG: response regulator [Bryobacteraceae bacterium]